MLLHLTRKIQLQKKKDEEVTLTHSLPGLPIAGKVFVRPVA